MTLKYEFQDTSRLSSPSQNTVAEREDFFPLPLYFFFQFILLS